MRLIQWLPFAAALAYAAIVVQHGVPALRHDWFWPADRTSLTDFLTRSTSGWDPLGVGGPNLYINDYLIALAIAPVILAFGSQVGLFVFALGIGLACAFGAAKLAGSFGADHVGQAAAALFATFNPWAYAETIAGHTYMLLAFGAAMSLAAECRRDQPRPLLAALLVALTLQQLQFFVLATAFVAARGWYTKSLLPLATAAIVGLPAVIAAWVNFGAIRDVPYTLEWEKSQSVAPAKAVLLSGYFAGYTQSIDRLDTWVMLALVALATFGFAAGWRQRWTGAVAIIAALTVLLAAGLDGPFFALERFAVAAVPTSALFRELFDFLGITALCYAAGIGLAAARAKVAGYAALAAGAALVAAWLVWSPWHWWVPAQSLVDPHVGAPENSRFALLPAFQPVRVRATMQGSGLDPDARIHTGNVVALNSMYPRYPVDAALAEFETAKDARPLAALSVFEIVERPWLASDEAALSEQRALPSAGDERLAAIDVVLTAAQPELALMPSPRTCSVCSRLGAGAVLFSDVAGMRGGDVPPAWSSYRSIAGVQPSRTSVRAGDGWVDARLAFASDPRLAQSFGGALTSAPDALLALPAAASALVYVRGELISAQGRLLTKTTGDYEWIALPRDVRAVRCLGLCVVAAAGGPPPGVPREARALPATALDMTELVPWLATATLPAGGAGLLRLNVAYDRMWWAWYRGGSLTHIRVDATMNGWLLPPRSDNGNVVIVEGAAACEALLEIVGAAWALALIAKWCATVFARSR